MIRAGSTVPAVHFPRRTHLRPDRRGGGSTCRWGPAREGTWVWKAGVGVAVEVPVEVPVDVEAEMEAEMEVVAPRLDP